MTVGGIVSEPLEVHSIGTRKGRAERCYASCSRWSASTRTSRTATRTSSRAASASGSGSRALALSPKLIICDEPVSALDVSIQAQILGLLKDLQRDFGLTYLFISHDLAVVRTMADEIAVMNQGKLVEVGQAEQVYSSPKDEYAGIVRRRAGLIHAASASEGRAGAAQARAHDQDVTVMYPLV